MIVAATLAVIGLGSVASADRHHSQGKVVVKSKISIKFRGGGDDPYAEQPNFSGRVTADVRRVGQGHHRRSRGGSDALEATCVRDRKVEIFRRNGPRLARTRTDRKGRYGVAAGHDFVAGKKYLATVDATKRKKGKTKVLCKGAASEVITAG